MSGIHLDENIIKTESGLLGVSSSDMVITDEGVNFGHQFINRDSILEIKTTTDRPYDTYAIIGVLLHAITGGIIAYRISYSLSFIWSANILLCFVLLGIGIVKWLRKEPYNRIIIETNSETYNIGLARQIDFIKAYELLESHFSVKVENKDEYEITENEK